MSLWNGVDLVSVASEGAYTEGYITATGGGNIANLMASFGLLEDAPDVDIVATVVQRLLEIGKSGIRFAMGLNIG